METDREQSHNDNNARNENVTLELDDNGHIFVRSQAMDYQLRGTEIEHMNLMEFFVDTYEEDVKSKDNKNEVDNNNTDVDNFATDDDGEEGCKKQG